MKSFFSIYLSALTLGTLGIATLSFPTIAASLPVLGRSSATSVANRGESLLAFDLIDIIPMGREVKKILNRDRKPTQVPSNSLPRNRQPRQPQSTDIVNQQEQQYVNSLSSEER